MIETGLGSLPLWLTEALGTGASVLTVLCVLPLVVLTLLNRAQPSPVTWGIWAPIGFVGTIGMALGGAPLFAWVLKAALSTGPLLVFAAALYGSRRYNWTWRTDGFDVAAIGVGALGTLTYAVLQLAVHAPWAGLVAVGTAILVDMVGVWPTWVRAVRNPHGELITTYALALVSVLVVLATLPLPWTWIGETYLVFLALQMASVISVLWAGRLLEGRRAARAAEPVFSVGE